eukprot:TRINITY_DN65462_c0_g1_i1.p1 TRINITY_DN65462_c0_g1~~TRINITY_DN65462_c0_g1_i1.p1  ORF type:complete len:764 (+),score=199.17 TRINITY_DN65462_c0_g1_i1:113-2404(+)
MSERRPSKGQPLALLRAKAAAREKQPGEVECPICYTKSMMRKLSPCNHGLCTVCVGKLQQLCSVAGKEPKCPLCRQAFVVLSTPAPLVALCLDKLQWRLPKAPQIAKLPASIRKQLLLQMKNKRLLYGDVLLEILRGLSLEVLPLQNASNMASADVRTAVQVLAEPLPQAVNVSNVAGFDDDGLRAVLERLAPNLELMDASCCDEKFEGLPFQEPSCSLPRLHTLIFAGCSRFQADSVVAIARGCAATLQVLDISGCRVIGNEAVASLAACRQLRRLNLKGIWQLETPAIVDVVMNCDKLTALDLTFCSRVSGPGLFTAIAATGLELTDLRVGCVGGIDDDSMLQMCVSTTGASLQKLALQRSEVSAKSLQVMARHCPALQQLDLSDCQELTENILMDTVVDMPQLRILTVKHCRQISSQVQLYLAQLLSARALGMQDVPLKRSTRSSLRPHRAPTLQHGDDDCCSPKSCASPSSSGSHTTLGSPVASSGSGSSGSNGSSGSSGSSDSSGSAARGGSSSSAGSPPFAGRGEDSGVVGLSSGGSSGSNGSSGSSGSASLLLPPAPSASKTVLLPGAIASALSSRSTSAGQSSSSSSSSSPPPASLLGVVEGQASTEQGGRYRGQLLGAAAATHSAGFGVEQGARGMARTGLSLLELRGGGGGGGGGGASPAGSSARSPTSTGGIPGDGPVASSSAWPADTAATVRLQMSRTTAGGFRSSQLRSAGLAAAAGGAAGRLPGGAAGAGAGSAASTSPSYAGARNRPR